MESLKFELDFYKRFCKLNPFYIGSAILVLFSISYIQFDDDNSLKEYCFYVSVLVLYQLLLSITGLFLSRIKVWHDATLLICLDHLFLLTPICMINYAFWGGLDIGIMLFTLLIIVVLSALKYLFTAKYFSHVNMPKWYYIFGIFLILISVSFSYITYFLHQHAVLEVRGMYMSIIELSYYALSFIALPTFFLKRQTHVNDDLPQNKRTFPILVIGFWAVSFMLNSLTMSYIYDYPFHLKHLIPLMFISFWVLYFKMNVIFDTVSKKKQNVTLIAIAFVSLISHGILLSDFINFSYFNFQSLAISDWLIIVILGLNIIILTYLYLKYKSTLILLVLVSQSLLFFINISPDIEFINNRMELTNYVVLLFFVLLCYLERKPIVTFFILIFLTHIILNLSDNFNLSITYSLWAILAHSALWGKKYRKIQNVLMTVIIIHQLLSPAYFTIKGLDQPIIGIMMSLVLSLLIFSTYFWFKKRVLLKYFFLMSVVTIFIQSVKLINYHHDFTAASKLIVLSLILFTLGTIIAYRKRPQPDKKLVLE